MPVHMAHEIEIRCTAEQLFNYVTQPWRWHEWHPDSKGATAAKQVLTAGDEFDETIAVKPLQPLPFTVTRNTHYVVRESVPHTVWSAEGKFSDGWVSFRYQIEPSGEGVLFKRTMQFEVTGPMRLLVPIVTAKQRKKSVTALQSLKRRVESMTAN
jgi:hypothetical protein